ncbi:hypothetical protein SPAR67_2395 [Streptococcus pneumoniae GA41277]|nr:hypothetical protein SPAR67_2395 [Streptococcus pneumoniae GA41277]
MKRSEGPSYRYKKPEYQNGDLRTPLTFYTSKIKKGLMVVM